MKRMPGYGGAAEDGLGCRIHAAILPVLGALSVAGCKGPQSTLDPAGPSAQAIATVWWWMLAVAVLVLVGVVAAWLLAMRRGAVSEPRSDSESLERRWLVWGGLVLPSVSIAALVVFGSPAGLHQLPFPGGGRDAPAPLEIQAIGHQWWWELNYPTSGVTLRNEMRIPAGRPVDVLTGSADVIHSFWVPRLGGKLDAVPGRTFRVRLQADEPGVYRGQCAEFCGRDHAHMTMTVIAMEAAEFEAWLASAASRPPAPASAPAAAASQ